MKRMAIAAGAVILLLLATAGCDEGIDDWNSSATVTGTVYTNAQRTQGVPGVQVVIESDPESETPYEGPDRWCVSDNTGHFQGAVFLGSKDGNYNYVADLSVSYFYGNMVFAWNGGITVSPGSNFTLPPVDLSMFRTLTSGGQ